MISVRIAVILYVLFLLLLSHANRLPHAADESMAVDPVTQDEPEDAKSTILVSPVDTKETATVVSLPDLVEGFDHVDLSLRHPFHHHRHSHRHRYDHPFHGGEVVPYGNDMIPGTRNVELNGGLNKEEETAAVAPDEELVKPPEGGGDSGVPEVLKPWHNEVPEWKAAAEKDCRRRKNKKEDKKNRDKEDSDSDSDDEEEEIKMVKKRPKKMKETESGGWLKWFWSFWE